MLTRRQLLFGGLAAVGGSAVALPAWALHEADSLQLERVRVQVRGLDRPLKVAQLSDIHWDHANVPWRSIERAVEVVNALDVDLVGLCHPPSPAHPRTGPGPGPTALPPRQLRGIGQPRQRPLRLAAQDQKSAGARRDRRTRKPLDRTGRLGGRRHGRSVVRPLRPGGRAYLAAGPQADAAAVAQPRYLLAVG
ncbi:MAG: hypothetical protein KME03_00620 [Aphanocapsa lilacina HA4352-LM1]|nr:hypothetical protein [Aphanocapsa lilacina HA4352-LM1]